MNGLLKVRSLRIGCPMYFRLSAALFYKRCRTSRTSAGQQSTKAKRADLIRSQVCSSLLQSYGEQFAQQHSGQMFQCLVVEHNLFTLLYRLCILLVSSKGPLLSPTTRGECDKGRGLVLSILRIKFSLFSSVKLPWCCPAQLSNCLQELSCCPSSSLPKQSYSS